MQPKSVHHTRPKYVSDWVFLFDPNMLKEYSKLFIVTNQSDHRVNLDYIENVKKAILEYIPDTTVLIARNRDKYRKPYPTFFIETILPKISVKNDTLTFVGDQICDYYFYCNSILHAPEIKHHQFFYAKNWYGEYRKPTEPMFDTKVYKNSKPVSLKPNNVYFFYVYKPEMVVESYMAMYPNLTLVKKYKMGYSHYTHKATNVNLYIGDFSIDKQKCIANYKYVINTENDCERYLRYKQLTTDATYMHNAIERFYNKIYTMPKIAYVAFFPHTDSDLTYKYLHQLF